MERNNHCKRQRQSETPSPPPLRVREASGGRRSRSSQRSTVSASSSRHTPPVRRSVSGDRSRSTSNHEQREGGFFQRNSRRSNSRRPAPAPQRLRLQASVPTVHVCQRTCQNRLNSVKQSIQLIAGAQIKNVLPEFDPLNKNHRIDVWIRKVNEYAAIHNWDEDTIVLFALQKLQGLAKTWYRNLDTVMYSWSEWQQKLMAAFPFVQNYGQALEEMIRRRNKFNEPLEIYFHEKMALLKRCNIEGKRAVDCIIHGLNEETLKTTAVAMHCTEPSHLLRFLMTNQRF